MTRSSVEGGQSYSEENGLSEAQVLHLLGQSMNESGSVETTLRTDKRVLARVTDGIYRQPGSALRELISNAHDADATRVVIRTDRPRFQRIVVEDDGFGMSPEALVHLLYHIGGSAKRTIDGQDLGITRTGDPTRSPGGRKLIGKIGIGLFSVAQLTQAFQIVTKTKGAGYRSVASVVLRQYGEQGLGGAEEEETEYEAGQVAIWKESATDREAHGTTIILTAMRPQTRQTLQSFGLWQSVFPDDTSDEFADVDVPRFNIGAVAPGREEFFRTATKGRGHQSLPWSPNDPPAKAFRELEMAVWQAQFEGDPNPRVSRLFDYYLKMVWDLSLQSPIRYTDIHPFDVTGSSEGPRVFDLRTYPPPEVTLEPGETVREYFELGDVAPQATGFRVLIDDLELTRPIDVRAAPPTAATLQRPMLFVASHREEFTGADQALTGGPLAFQAYVVWAPKIVPAEHAGVTIRVHNASGTSFDETFLRYPVAEQRRLAQMSCEIFITEGFDGALNIDRESFNYAHPHVVALTRWLHASLKQIIATQKRLGTQARASRQQADQKDRLQALTSIVSRVWAEQNDDDATEPPNVKFVESGASPQGAPAESAYLLDRRRVVGDVSPGPRARERQQELQQRMESVAVVLAAFGLLDVLTEDERVELLEAIREIMQASR